MRIAMLGATGRTGRHVLTALLDRGHDVRVLVRTPATLGSVASAVEVLQGDSRDEGAIARLLEDRDAVLSALGPVGKDATLHQDTAACLILTMQATGPRRFVGISGAGMDVPGDLKSRRDKLITALIRTVGGAVVADKPAEHARWEASGLDWTLVRPPRLTNGPATGRLEHDAHRSPRGTSLTRADLGAFLVSVVEDDLYPRAAPLIANR